MHENLAQAVRGIVTVGGTPVVRRVRLLGNLFDPDKCFLLPDALEGLKKVVLYHSLRPFDQVVILSHVPPEKSESLALDRAKMVRSFLTNEWKDWLPWFRPAQAGSARWGVREAQLILGHLGHYQGHAAGRMDAPTSTALLEFKRRVNQEGKIQIPVTGHLDGPTRQVLLWKYCQEEGTAFWKGMRPVALGSVHNPDPFPLQSGAEIDPERLEILFFERTYYPRPSTDLLAWDDQAYQVWMQNIVESGDLEFLSFTLRVTDGKNQGIAGARVRVEGPKAVEQTTDEHGWVVFRDLARGQYSMKVWNGERPVGTSTIQVPNFFANEG